MRIKYVILLVIVFIALLNFANTLVPNRINRRSPISLSPAKAGNPESIPLLSSLETIFQEDHTWIATVSADRLRTILVTGDIIPARAVNFNVMKKNNMLWPYEKVANTIHSLNADMVFTNLETPLLKECPTTVDGMIFCGSYKNIEGLQSIGVDVASVANNHFGNYGKAGIEESLQLLESSGIAAAGTAGPFYKDIRGVRFAFLAYNDIDHREEGINWSDEALIKKEIQEARDNAHVVIVMFHWGIEYQAQPDERQRYLAHYTIDQGADLIVSNHPHWIQPVEFYKGKTIMYAHGNFIFDQMWSQKTREGVLGLYTFYDDNLIDIQFFPLQINDYGQAVFLGGIDKQKVLHELKEASFLLQNSNPIHLLK